MQCVAYREVGACCGQGRKFRLTVGGDNIHKISQDQFLKGTQIIQLKLFL